MTQSLRCGRHTGKTPDFISKDKVVRKKFNDLAEEIAKDENEKNLSETDKGKEILGNKYVC